MDNKIHNPYSKFKGWLREKNLTYSDIGKVLGVNASTVHRKINGNSDFSLTEVNALKDFYGLQTDIFL